jgi:hypothetical protein
MTMDVLIQRRDMIAEYFSLVVTEGGNLNSIPLLLKDYTPNYGKLPAFIRRLGRNVPSSTLLSLSLHILTLAFLGRLVHGKTLLRILSQRISLILYPRTAASNGR